ncbi:DUF2147 domain-containing protein [Desulforhabdus amnigena]|jgi:uncharacterized protein (DUF2147 family)|uniref:DUF2147 domain-containing protein n=1 Tax=Desulforhabdus amnigena TaxID=40218 RepID=A0A9W6FVA8_9BACT|nr:DUF2147 domain-containing protein [Desulforhabdus amnigena]NLJ28101.1 DUF2147 domain-containing protein [Deltaproteobacteria bacterium]GLI35508.1 hypothetical protein DAMNIGENAA_29410 [Desulforhabdus amnigena]
MFKFILLLLSLVLFMPGSSLHASDGDAILGVWNTRDKDAKIEIYRCGTKYCGKIAWLEEPDFPPYDEGGMAGLPKVDRNNPDPRLRSRPYLGLEILQGFSYSGDNKWEKGRIYNPENGKFYKAKISMDGNNRLKLRGFMGVSFFGRTETWTR